MDEYCRGCRFLVQEGAVCHCLKGWPPKPCPSRESGTPTKADIAQGILDGFVPMKAPEVSHGHEYILSATCEGCPYYVPTDEDDPCHVPRRPPPPHDANCAEDWAEDQREADAEEEHIREMIP